MRQSSYGVHYEALDLVSDLPDPLKWVQGADGILWFVTQRGFARVDPKKMYRNPLAPTVVIRSLAADDRVYSTFRAATLPALTRSIRVDYTALSLSIPERVKFRYGSMGWTGVGAKQARPRGFVRQSRPGGTPSE
ncbi:MAG: hypothetical protein WDO73_12635 [Ignavibacteriota bacterium]